MTSSAMLKKLVISLLNAGIVHFETGKVEVERVRVLARMWAVFLWIVCKSQLSV